MYSVLPLLSFLMCSSAGSDSFSRRAHTCAHKLSSLSCFLVTINSHHLLFMAPPNAALERSLLKSRGIAVTWKLEQPPTPAPKTPRT